MKLKVKFVKFDKALAMQVLEQSERGFDEFTAKNGIAIRSMVSPQITNGAIFLRGTMDTSDCDINALYCKTNGRRDEHLKNCLEALDEFMDYMNNAETEADSENNEIIFAR